MGRGIIAAARGILSLFALAALAGCASTAQHNEFAELSRAGIVYADAAEALVTRAADATIAADSAALILARESSEPEQRDEQLTRHSGRLRDQLAILSDIQRHQRLLRDYFVALGGLANAGEVDGAYGTAARDALQALGRLSPRFGSLTAGGQSIAALAGEAAPLLVAKLRAGALQRELERNGTALNRELQVSEALAAFLAEQIAADDLAVQDAAEYAAVYEPYLGGGALPRDWAARRAQYLKYRTDLGAVASAQDAARKLRLALAAAAGGTLAPGQLQALVQDLNALLDALERLRRAP